jgi:LAO/AO transport system kinase
MVEKAFSALWEGLLRGERLFLSKAITLVETSNPALFPWRDWLLMQAEKLPARETFRLAVTGLPGAGKSTLINQLGLQWIKEGHKVAVLAIDPSSEVSQGSVLGDKTRMADLAREENAFIRPSPTRLHLGGVASSTFETIMLCEAAGYDRILVETVGVGQSELEAAQLTDACLLLLIAGAGDELQAVKRGILESADVILINKADGENLEKAKSAAKELQNISSLWALKPGRPHTDVLYSSSMDNSIFDMLVTQLNLRFAKGMQQAFFTMNRETQKRTWFQKVLRNHLFENIRKNESLTILLAELEQKQKNGVGLVDLFSELDRRVVIETINNLTH